MAKRKDGIETRDRILGVGCEIFAEKGYHDATVEEICGQAETNIAAINYHFGSKEQLYAKVWRRAFDEAIEAYPPEGGLGPDAPPAERLRGVIYSLVGRTLDPGRIGHAGKLLLREMAYPTDAIEQLKQDTIYPLHRRLYALMQELLGPQASHEQVLLCQMSIIHQCIPLGIRMFMGQVPPHMEFNLPADHLVETVADHITRFSLAGIAAVREDIEATTHPL